MDSQISVNGQRINLGVDQRFSDSALKKANYLLIGLSLIMSVLNFISYLEKGTEFTRYLIQSGVYFLFSILFFLRIRIEFSPTSKYAAHFMISENGLKMKRGVFKKSEFIHWQDVQKIELGNYKLGIKDKTGLQYYPYQTRKETSIAIKRAIEAIAAQKGIEVENLLKK